MSSPSKKVKIDFFKNQAKLCLRMFKISWQLRWSSVVLYFSGAALEIGSSILSIYATAKIASILAHFLTTNSAPHIWWWLIADIGAAVGIGIGFMLMSYARRVLYLQFGHWATVKFQSALCQIDLPGFYEEKTRNKINKVSQGYTWQISNLAQNNLDLAYGILRFLAITVVVSQITWWIVPLIALFLIPSLIAEGKLAKSQWFVWDSKGDERHVFWGFDFIMRQPKGQMELRSTQASKFALEKIDTMLEKFYSEQEDKLKQSHTAIVGTKMLEVVGTAVGSIYLLRQVLLSQISLDRYFFLSGALLRVGGALNTIFGSLARLQETLLFAESFFELIDYKPAGHDVDQPIDISEEKDLHIVIKNVTFSYPDQEKPVFEDLNLEIKPGEHVAIVGENGAGKTTLMKLLMRFYKPDSGQILINGYDLNDIAIESWYSKMATLFQEFNQYPLPIDENIQIGRSSKPVNDSLLQKAVRLSGVDSLIKKYKFGWETVLDASFKKGIEPSGGQWQRVALARAFYRDAPILILDEPTSAIDANAEFSIFNSIFKEYQNRTTIIVSHRFSTVRRADRIIVIDKGKILEQGSHKELMKREGLYHDLFSKQAEGYK